MRNRAVYVLIRIKRVRKKSARPPAVLLLPHSPGLSPCVAHSQQSGNRISSSPGRGASGIPLRGIPPCCAQHTNTGKHMSTKTTACHTTQQKMQEELRQLRHLRDEYDDRIQRLRWSIRSNKGMGADGVEDQAYRDALQLLQAAETDRAQLKARHSALLRNHHRQFHPVWGQLMRTGHQNSRFAHQSPQQQTFSRDLGCRSCTYCR
ncbi:hypothetical protein Vretifemale_19856, partial [Volvox reticuliferus]